MTADHETPGQRGSGAEQTADASAVSRLLAFSTQPDPYDYRLDDIWDVQLRAVRERLTTARAGMRVLDLLCASAGIDGVGELGTRGALVPLLFPHTVYKSYPGDGTGPDRWLRMTEWLDTLSTGDVSPYPSETDVTTLDDWMRLMQRSGHLVFTSSGTSGKVSILNQNAYDRDLACRLAIRNMGWGGGLSPQEHRPVFVLSSSTIAHRQLDLYRAAAASYSAPDTTYWLTDLPLSFRELFALADPSCTDPLAAGVGQAFEQMTDQLIAHRAEPVILIGFGPLHWRLAQRLQARGLRGLHPDTSVQAGAQTKGVDVPADFHAQVSDAFGVPASRFLGAYGMVETSAQFPRCDSGAYHVPPWVVPLILSPDATRLAPPADGAVTGRFALIDLTVSGRWCGLASGDEVTMTTRHCGCGRAGMSVVTARRMSDGTITGPYMPAQDRVAELVQLCSGAAS